MPRKCDKCLACCVDPKRKRAMIYSERFAEELTQTFVARIEASGLVATLIKARRASSAKAMEGNRPKPLTIVG